MRFWRSNNCEGHAEARAYNREQLGVLDLLIALHQVDFNVLNEGYGIIDAEAEFERVNVTRTKSDYSCGNCGVDVDLVTAMIIRSNYSWTCDVLAVNKCDDYFGRNKSVKSESVRGSFFLSMNRNSNQQSANKCQEHEFFIHQSGPPG